MESVNDYLTAAADPLFYKRKVLMMLMIQAADMTFVKLLILMLFGDC